MLSKRSAKISSTEELERRNLGLNFVMQFRYALLGFSKGLYMTTKKKTGSLESKFGNCDFEYIKKKDPRLKFAIRRKL